MRDNDSSLHPPFARLGHGSTLISRKTAVEFIEPVNGTRRNPPFADDGKRTAVNYFTFLSNRVLNMTVDRTKPLGEEYAFAVGAGDDRNWKYIVSP